jgi:hypothetical protein
MIFTTWRTKNCSIPITVISARIDIKANTAARAKTRELKYNLPHNGRDMMDLMVDVDNNCYLQYRKKERVAFMNLRTSNMYRNGFGIQFYYSRKCNLDRSGKDGNKHNIKEYKKMINEKRITANEL